MADTVAARRPDDRGRALEAAIAQIERSFGKGTIQQWHLLSNQSGGFRLSVAKWLTPEKRWIHGTGLAPDVAVGAGSSGTDQDPQLARAIETLIGDATPSGPLVPATREPAPTPSASPIGMGWPLRVGIEGPIRRLA